MRLSRAALLCVLLVACREPALPGGVARPERRGCYRVDRHERTRLGVAGAGGGARHDRPSAARGRAGHAAALAWLPADTAAPRGVQTAVAASQVAAPRPAPEQVDPRALAADPEQHAGKHVLLVGQVARRIDQGAARWVEFLALPPGETAVQSVDLLLANNVAAIEREECYTVVGVATGATTWGTPSSAARRDAPLVLVSEVVTAPVGPYGIGCAAPVADAVQPVFAILAASHGSLRTRDLCAVPALTRRYYPAAERRPPRHHRPPPNVQVWLLPN